MSIIIPVVASRIRIEYSNFWRFSPGRKWVDIRIAAADPVNARSLRKRAKLSTTKLPPKVTSLPPGSQTMMAPVRINSRIAAPSILLVACSPRNAPTISSAMAPSASTISGRAGSRAGISSVSGIDGSRLWSMRQQGGGLRRTERALVVLEQLRNRSRREVEHRLRVDAEQDGQDDQRTQGNDLAIVEVLDQSQAGLGQRAEDDLAVEPQRVGGRQNGADGRQRRYPGIHPESADEGEEL